MKKMRDWRLTLLLLVGISGVVQARDNNRDPFKDIEMTQRLLEMRKQQEYIDEQLKYPTRNEKKEQEQEKFQIEDGEKYLFKTIKVEGSKHYKKEIDKILAQYINTEMGKVEIYELLTKLSNVYLNKGYMTTLVTIKSGNVKKGELIYEVKEGKLRSIKYMDRPTTYLGKARIDLAFPMKKGDLLNTQDMDQGLENLNVGGNNNVTEVTPTELYGYSDIIIEESYRPTGFGFGIDNSGYKDKGREKLNINFSQDNLLGINDRLSLNYIERLTKSRTLDKEANYDIGYSVPVGYWNFSYNYNLGDNYNTVISDLGKYKSESRSEKHKFKASRVLSRGQYDKTTLHTGIVFKDNYNTMNGLVLDVSTKKYTNLTFAIDHTNRLFGGTFFGMIEYERGVPWFGAEGDPPVLKSGDYKVEYDKVNFNLDWMRSLSLADHGFQYRMKIGGAYSDDRLLSANQFNMGDEFTVRGFKESSVAGNKGVYINNTVTYMGYQGMNRILSMFKPFIGFDMGVSRDKDLPTSDRLVGMALGLKFNTGALSGGFTYGIPLRRASKMPREGNPIYFNINYNL